jgi:hypothetical protein
LRGGEGYDQRNESKVDESFSYFHCFGTHALAPINSAVRLMLETFRGDGRKSVRRIPSTTSICTWGRSERASKKFQSFHTSTRIRQAANADTPVPSWTHLFASYPQSAAAASKC